MNQVNGGSRTQANPEGNGVLERERRANIQALYVVEICLALHAVGAFFSIENPVPSHLWICAAFKRLMRVLHQQLFIVTFDQCAFRLSLPGCSEVEFCKKKTRVWSNMRELNRLERFCPGKSDTHQHVHAVGNVTIAGIRYSRAAAAGRYPLELCETFATAGHDARCRTFRGAAL